MGNALRNSSAKPAIDTISTDTKKRKVRDEWECDENFSEIVYAKSNKRRRLKSTSDYIYNALFLEGENSDIKIRALNCEWNLHKVYLRQAGYFSGMFNSSWKESSMKVIDLHIPDSKINEEALKIAFGSLYSHEIVILPSQVISVLAAASLIQMEGLMEQCSEVMIDSLSCGNICSFYHEALVYGQKSVEEACLKWLENNLMLQTKKFSLLSNIDPPLMTKVLTSSDLFVLQVEMDIYTMLKKWLYLRVSINGDKTSIQSKTEREASSVVRKYFRELFSKTNIPFLETADGLAFKDAFRAIRYCNILRDFSCCLEVEKDGVVPHSWLMPLYRERWLTMLRVEQGVDRGPGDVAVIDQHSLRCGRVLNHDMDYCWRWNGYNFGFDLLITYNSQQPRTLLLKRNIQSQRRIASVGLVVYRKIIYHIRVFSLDDKGKVLNYFAAGPSLLTLEKDEEKAVLTLEEDNFKKIKFPLMISASFRVVSGGNIGNSSYDITPLPTSSKEPIKHT